ncbi:MAG TPA: arsenite methyltransferase [Thermodesulfobacteriota bacterium]|nr:arsenite methyltransferase [Thermodesulfobacteriota bacterium]
MESKGIKDVVKERYGKIAKQGTSCCESSTSCCGSPDLVQAISKEIGYSDEELKAVPEGANLGLGCGNPLALSSIREGETVLDLGSGAGFDCFLAAAKVGKNGRVIGVDMTSEMIEKARENAKKGNYGNIEFRLGEIEKLPVANDSVDLIISNCVINLSPDKGKVFQEAFRVLKPGGRLMISDIVLLQDLPSFVRENIEAYIGCVSGAIRKDEYLQKIEAAGFQDVKVMGETPFSVEFIFNDPMVKSIIEKSGLPTKKVTEIAGSVVSTKVYGVKPVGRS